MNVQQIRRQLDAIEFTITAIRQELNDDDGPARPMLDEIAAYTIATFGLDSRRFYGNKRQADVVNARAAFAMAAYQNGYTLKAIGIHIHKDHSSIVHLRRDYELRTRQWPEYQDMMNKVTDNFRRQNLSIT